MVDLFINTNSLLYGGTASVPFETTKFEHNLKKILGNHEALLHY